MFYRPEDGHDLPHNPFNAIVAPRPIGWISTRGSDGSENLAPYSFFNAVAYTPPQVVFASTSAKPDRDGTKDTVANIRDTGVFCCNVVSVWHESGASVDRGSRPSQTMDDSAPSITHPSPTRYCGSRRDARDPLFAASAAKTPGCA